MTYVFESSRIQQQVIEMTVDQFRGRLNVFCVTICVGMVVGLAGCGSSSVPGESVGGDTPFSYLGALNYNEDAEEFTRPTGWIRALAFSPDGNVLASCSHDKRDNSLVIWDWRNTGIRFRHEEGDGGVWAIAFSPDSRLIASGHGDGSIRIWQMGDGKKLVELPPKGEQGEGHEARVTALVFPLTNVLISGSANGKMCKWHLDFDEDRRLGELQCQVMERWSVEAHEKGISSLAALFDEEAWYESLERFKESEWPLKIVSGSSDRTVKLWNEQHAGLDVLEEHDFWVGGVALSPDGSTVISAGSDEKICYWTEGGSTAIEEAHTRPIRSLALSPDGNWLVTGDVGGTIKAWQPRRPGARGTSVGSVVGHQCTGNAIVYSLAFHPDSRVLASVGADKVIRLWKLPESPDPPPRSHFQMENPFVIVLDTSGSMAGILSTVKGRLQVLVQELRNEGRVYGNIISFSDEAESAFGDLGIQELSDQRTAQLVTYLGSDLPSGGTVMFPALELSAQQIRQFVDTGDLRANQPVNIVIVTDGALGGGRDIDLEAIKGLFDGLPVKIDTMTPRLFDDMANSLPANDYEAYLAVLAREFGGRFGRPRVWEIREK